MPVNRYILMRAISVACREVQRAAEDLGKVPPAMRIVAIVQAGQGIIDSGGLRGFFGADFPNTPPYSIFVEAYRAIGAHAAADALEEAVEVFPFDSPHLSVNERREYMRVFRDESLCIDVDPVECAESDALPASPFESIARRLCGNEEVWVRLAEFVQANANVFGLKKPRRGRGS